MLGARRLPARGARRKEERPLSRGVPPRRPPGVSRGGRLGASRGRLRLAAAATLAVWTRLLANQAAGEPCRGVAILTMAILKYLLLARPVEVEPATLDLSLRADAEPRDGLRALPQRAQRGESHLATADPPVDARGVHPAW